MESNKMTADEMTKRHKKEEAFRKEVIMALLPTLIEKYDGEEGWTIPQIILHAWSYSEEMIELEFTG